MTPLEKYLRSLREIRSTGHAVKETSYYGALETLLNDAGASLKPCVRCVINLQNRGAGTSDFQNRTSKQSETAVWGCARQVCRRRRTAGARNNIGAPAESDSLSSYLVIKPHEVQ